VGVFCINCYKTWWFAELYDLVSAFALYSCKYIGHYENTCNYSAQRSDS
jgi:hypothetical protein